MPTYVIVCLVSHSHSVATRVASYVDNWRRTKRRVLVISSTVAVLILIGPMFAAFPTSWDDLFRGQRPEPLTTTLWAVLGGAFLFILLVWLIVAKVFRRYGARVLRGPRSLLREEAVVALGAIIWQPFTAAWRGSRFLR